MSEPLVLWDRVQATLICVCDPMSAIDVDDCTLPCYVECPQCKRQWQLGTNPVPITLWIGAKKP